MKNIVLEVVFVSIDLQLVHGGEKFHFDICLLKKYLACKVAEIIHHENLLYIADGVFSQLKKIVSTLMW